MWWARSHWSAVGTERALRGVRVEAETDGDFVVDAEVAGPPCGFWSCPTERTYISLSKTFYLGRQRMPERSCLYESTPLILLTGSLGQHFGSSGSWSDDTSTYARYRRWQHVTNADEIEYPDGFTQESPAIIDDGGHIGSVNVQYTPMHVPAARFVLNHEKDLIIEVNLQFIFDIEGPNIPFLDLEVRILQWSIRRV